MRSEERGARNEGGSWDAAWRGRVWSELGIHRSSLRDPRPAEWDLIVIGGGITGAGIFREAARAGMRVLLLEKRDFAWGTSSRSSKLIHGGLRYLKQGKLGLVRDAVRERDELLRSAAGLVQPLGFLYASYQGDRPGPRVMGLGLRVYDMISGHATHQFHAPHEMPFLAPHIAQHGLRFGFRYQDAQVDDARLVLRLLRDGAADGGVPLNHAAVERVLFADGVVAGVRVLDAESGASVEVRAKVVINATGAWAAALRPEAARPERLRPLRGSHLVFPARCLPIAQAVSFLHPDDRRPVFVVPWEGVALVGTTDLDHTDELDAEPRISAAEAEYLMRAVNARFPGLDLGYDDVVSSFAGVRPVIDTGVPDPSAESREHGIWDDGGLITVTGGKLTTYRVMALEALARARQRERSLPVPSPSAPMFAPPPAAALPADLPVPVRGRLLGRYGADAEALARAARPDEWAPVGGSATLWAELRWAARAEAVVHLDDLLLRRTRLGLLLPDGGMAASVRERIGRICREELGWDELRWEAEVAAYARLWRHGYAPPPRPTERAGEAPRLKVADA
jgi:glycerol-3-phosphate dehydrogenase